MFSLKSTRLIGLSGQIYALYLLFAIVAPLILISVFDYWPVAYSKGLIDPLRLVFVITLLIAPLFLDAVTVKPLPRIRKNIKPVTAKIFLVAMIAISLFNIISGNSRWRYSDQSVSEIGGVWLYFFMIIPTLGKLLTLDIIFFRRSVPSSVSMNVLLVLMMLLTINGNMTAIFALVMSYFLLTGGNRFLYDDETKSGGFVGILVYVLAGVVGAAVVFIAYVYGESVKRGVNPYEVYIWIGENLGSNAEWLKELILGRISPTLVSMLHVAQENWCQTEPCRKFDFSSVLNTGLFRIFNLFGLTDAVNIVKDLNGTISRINYIEININPFNDREGTSPGVLPGFYYAFGSYLAAPMFLMYMAMQMWLLKRVSSLVKRKLSLVGKLLLLYLLIPLFESPLDIFMILDDSLIYRIGLIYICLRRVGMFSENFSQPAKRLSGATS